MSWFKRKYGKLETYGEKESKMSWFKRKYGKLETYGEKEREHRWDTYGKKEREQPSISNTDKRSAFARAWETAKEYRSKYNTWSEKHDNETIEKLNRRNNITALRAEREYMQTQIAQNRAKQRSYNQSGGGGGNIFFGGSSQSRAPSMFSLMGGGGPQRDIFDVMSNPNPKSAPQKRHKKKPSGKSFTIQLR